MPIRPATFDDAPGLARVQVDSYRTAYADFFPPEYLDQFSYAEQAQDWRDLISDPNWGDLLLVAVDAVNTVSGYALGRPGQTGIPAYDGELVALHVRADIQRQGVGRGLVRAMARSLRQAGCSAMLLWVIAANTDARAFYERLGAARLHGAQQTTGPGILEIAYGWPDLDDIVAPMKGDDVP